MRGNLVRKLKHYTAWPCDDTELPLNFLAPLWGEVEVRGEILRDWKGRRKRKVIDLSVAVFFEREVRVSQSG